MHDPVDPAALAPDTAPAELSIEVDGHEATYAATADLDDDGHDDSVLVPAHDGPDGMTDGGYAYTDTDGDGTADTFTELDARGTVVARAVVDADTGDWREVAQGLITVDTPNGPEVAGEASYDTDGDGVADTAVASTVDGTTLLVTDVDGDGAADLVTEVSSDGSYASFEHTGEGEWTEVDSGSLADGSGGPAPVTTDPATGGWTTV